MTLRVLSLKSIKKEEDDAKKDLNAEHIARN